MVNAARRSERDLRACCNDKKKPPGEAGGFQRLRKAQRGLLLALANGHKAEAQEAEDHHRPSGGFGYTGNYQRRRNSAVIVGPKDKIIQS
jgi:hypothetical protein